MCTRERALELGQKLEVVEDAERRIAEYDRKHGKPMSKTGQDRWFTALQDSYLSPVLHWKNSMICSCHSIGISYR